MYCDAARWFSETVRNNDDEEFGKRKDKKRKSSKLTGTKMDSSEKLLSNRWWIRGNRRNENGSVIAAAAERQKKRNRPRRQDYRLHRAHRHGQWSIPASLQIVFFGFRSSSSLSSSSPVDDNHCRYRSRDLRFLSPPCKVRSRYLTHLPRSYWVAYLLSDTYLPREPTYNPIT